MLGLYKLYLLLLHYFYEGTLKNKLKLIGINKGQTYFKPKRISSYDPLLFLICLFPVPNI